MENLSDNRVTTEPRQMVRTITLTCTVADAAKQTDTIELRNSAQQDKSTEVKTTQKPQSMREELRQSQRILKAQAQQREEETRRRQEYLELFREEIEEEYGRQMEVARQRQILQQ